MRAAILVPAQDYPEDWDWAYEVEAAALISGGFSVEARPWNEPGDLTGFDLVMPLVAWGYHCDPARWHGLLDRLEAERVPVLNPVPLLRWNSSKLYLAELGAQGISVIPTRIAEALDDDDIAAARALFGERLVIKPPVSAAADGTHLLLAGDPLPGPSRGRPMLVQPFLASVREEGEYSIMMFGEQFSHAIVKRPRPGDYRVQPHLGGSERRSEPPAGAIDLASAALAAAPARAAYARVDMVRDDDGSLAIIELELIEPALWLQHAPDGGAAFVAAIRRALG